MHLIIDEGMGKEHWFSWSSHWLQVIKLDR